MDLSVDSQSGFILKRQTIRSDRSRFKCVFKTDKVAKLYSSWSLLLY